MSYALEVKGLRKEYKNFALKDISFSLEEGCIMGFVGPNGAGKSTTIKAILNQVIKDAGEIRLWGKDSIEHEVELKNRIGVVMDEGHFYGHLSLKRMKSMIAPFYKNWSNQTYESYIRQFKLDEDKKISDLSKGMRMKYAIALALSHNADLLIMDEPTSGLDPLVREELLGILQQMIQDERKSVFFSTHITSDLDKVADYIVLINDGRLLLNEPKDELLDTHAVVKGSNELLTPLAEPLFVSVKKSSYGFEGLTKDRSAARRAFGDKAVIERPTIEDIMLHYIRRDNGNAISA
jgi:ABC-2 type transport system ATP-binding protein